MRLDIIARKDMVKLLWRMFYQFDPQEITITFRPHGVLIFVEAGESELPIDTYGIEKIYVTGPNESREVSYGERQEEIKSLDTRDVQDNSNH